MTRTNFFLTRANLDCITLVCALLSHLLITTIYILIVFSSQADKALLEKHYADLSARPFFPGLVEYMSSGPVVPMVWEGLNVVKTGRVMLGATNPADSCPGSIRGDMCIQVGRNICHGSDAVESANKEIALWFGEKELVSWKPCQSDWVYE